MNIEIGTIVLVPFPFTDLSGSKVRPALVLSNLNKLDVIVVFISSVVPAKLNETDFLVLGDLEIGLKKDSVIKCDKIMTLSKSIILGEIGKLPSKVFQKEIKSRLKVVLSLD